MTVTYTITEGQLVKMNDGVPEDAIDLDAAFNFRDALMLVDQAEGTAEDNQDFREKFCVAIKSVREALDYTDVE